MRTVSQPTATMRSTKTGSSARAISSCCRSYHSALNAVDGNSDRAIPWRAPARASQYDAAPYKRSRAARSLKSCQTPEVPVPLVVVFKRSSPRGALLVVSRCESERALEHDHQRHRNLRSEEHTSELQS